jgi:hypothetical protein
MFSLGKGAVAGMFAFAISATCPLNAQIALDGHQLQIHGFASQGFSYSDNNNYLTMQTSSVSFAFTDAGLNVSTSLTDKLRVGAQTYVREIGLLGRGHVTLDWASADYRFTDWLGIRAGKVKTVFGLYDDTQDAESVHTWALLPQSIYPLDLRSNSLAHVGADLYGIFVCGGSAALLIPDTPADLRSVARADSLLASRLLDSTRTGSPVRQKGPI